MVLSHCLVKEYTNTANGDPKAQKEKGIQLTATFQTVKKDSFIQRGKMCSFKKKLFQRQGIIKGVFR